MSLTEGLTTLAATTATRSGAKNLNKVAALLERSGIPLEEIGRVKNVRLSTYQGITKDDDGVAHVHDLESTSLVLSPSWADGPAWPVVQPAAPVQLPPADRRPSRTNAQRTAVVLPDPQIGFRDLDGELDPFHDDAAMAVALQIVERLHPEVVVNLGDIVDFPAHSRFVQERAWANTTQAALDRTYRFLAAQRVAAPDAELVLLEGNHDRRLETSIVANAMASFGLRRAEQPASWPVLSLPHLLHFDTLDVNYVQGYPAGEYWINDSLRCIHGLKVRSGGSTASAVVKDDHVSTIFGHIHRIELQHQTRHDRYGPIRTFAATPGCLCRVDGAVPSMKGSTDLSGRPVRSWEDWQQGLAVVSWGDGPTAIELVTIENGVAYFRGERYAA